MRGEREGDGKKERERVGVCDVGIRSTPVLPQ